MATVNIVHNCIPSDFTCPPGLPDLGNWFYPWGWKLVRMMINRIFLPRVNSLRSREGLIQDTDVMTQTWAAERLNLLAVSPSICNRPKDWMNAIKCADFWTRLKRTGKKYGRKDLMHSLLEVLHRSTLLSAAWCCPTLQRYERRWASGKKRLKCLNAEQLYSTWDDLSAFERNKMCSWWTVHPMRKCSHDVLQLFIMVAQEQPNQVCWQENHRYCGSHADQTFWGLNLNDWGLRVTPFKENHLLHRNLQGYSFCSEGFDHAKKATAIGQTMVEKMESKSNSARWENIYVTTVSRFEQQPSHDRAKKPPGQPQPRWAS